jgi:hypothetical protein
VDFSESRDLFVNIFQILGPNCKFLDCGLILEKSRGLNAKCPKLEFLGIIFLKETRGPSPRTVNGAGHVRGPPWTDGGTDRRRGSVAARSPEYGLRPLWCTKAHRRGRQRERGARGSRLGPHRSSGGGVVTGRCGGAKRSQEARWGGVPAREGGEEGGSVRCGVLWGSSGWLL